MTSASETSSRRGYSVDGGLMPSGDLRVLSRPGRASFERSEDGWIRRDLFMYGNKENRPLMDGSGTGVRQQQQPPHVGPTESVPLAEMDDFSESLCMSSDESTKRCSRTDSDSYLTNRDGVSLDGNTTSGDEADVSSLVAATGSAKVAKRKRKSKNRRGKTVRNERPPRPGECGTLVDERASVSSMYKWWLNQIEEQDNLERCYFSGHNDKSHKDSDYAMIEFAERYYNNHYIFFGYSSALTKTVNIVRRKSFTEVVPLEDMLKWPKSSSIPTSHVHLLEAEDVIQACSIFKDLYRYVKGEVKGEIGVSLIRSLMAKAKDRVELRDEMYCQLLRLSNANPSLDNTLRAWAVMAVCSVAFTPSHTLLKYFISYLRQHCDDSEEFPFSAKVKPYAQYCLQHVTSHRQAPRQRVPSLVEIQAVLTLQPLVYRIYFLDGTTKAIACDPGQSVEEALHLIKDKMALKKIEGWALYESTPNRERYIKSTEYLSDILSQWEQKQHKDQSLLPSPKKLSVSPRLHAQNYGKLIMCKRLFQRISEIPDDPVELHLMYSQSVHSVVQLDEYMVPIHIALHLAGIQAQVEFDDFEEDKLYRYQEEETFLSERILCSDSRDWRRDISEAHQRYGKGKTLTEAQYKYLVIVSQFQLYGCTKIFAHYSGVWSYGTETILAIGYEGIQCISLQKKMLLFDYRYDDIEQIMLDELYDASYIILVMSDSVSQSQQKCFIFECLNLEDFVSLIEFYSPEHATWTQSSEHWRKAKFQVHHDWLKVYEDTLNCRRALMERDITKKSTSNTVGLLKTALHRISSRNCGTGRRSDAEQDDIAVSSFWFFSRSPMKSALTKCVSHEMEDVAVRMFNSTLVYTGFESTALLEDTDLVVVVQTLITKCMEHDDLCNEFFLQLIKQTTHTQSELNQKGIHRYWHLLTIALCVMLPSNEIIFNYLNLHLRRYAMQENTEEGKYAHFCIKSLYRTYENKGRRYPPSYREIHFLTKRQPIEAHVYISDGHVHFIEFDSSTTAREMLPMIKAKTGMRTDAEGYGIYQVSGDREIYIKPDDKLADAMYNWERISRLDTPGTKNMVLMFKKRLFVEPYVNINDPVEVDLLYNQSVTDVFDQKIPLTKSDATYLCALRAQFEYGDYHESSSYDYHAVMRILPRHLRDLLVISDIVLLHKGFVRTSCVQINIAFIEILKQWPLYGSTMFKVTTNIDTLPKVLWFAVSPMGIHFMEIKGPNIYYTYTFDQVTSCTPTNKNLTIVVNKNSQKEEFFFYTNEGEQIVWLIKDYSQCVSHPSLENDVMSQAAKLDQDNASIESVTLDISS